MAKMRRLCEVALVCWASVLVLGGCAENGGTAADRAGPQAPAASVAAPVNLPSGPLATFEGACAACHGSLGGGYEDGFFRLSDMKMAREVREMMLGRARLKSSDTEISAMTAYHLALRDRRPFACIINGAAVAGGEAGELKGEVTPGSTVRIEKDGTATPAVVDGFTWRASSPPSPPFNVLIEKGDARRSFEFPARMWSD